LIAYFISNIFAKRYQNPFPCLEVIASQKWDVFRHGVYSVFGKALCTTDATRVNVFVTYHCAKRAVLCGNFVTLTCYVEAALILVK